jgi:penicillin-binding protein 2
MRLYPYKELGCHILGYLREVSKARLERFKKLDISNLSLGDYNGVWGIEHQLDNQLRGQNGRRPVIEDAFGRELGEASSDFLLPTLRRKDAIPGLNVFLTIDFNLQKVAEDAFGDKAGAAVAMDPRSGEILAMVSKPCLDLSKFSRNIPQDYWTQINNDPLVPLYDRATMGIYPPGSTFKMITASAGLRAGIAQTHITSHYQSCKGSYRIGRETKRCWKSYPGHGSLGVSDAITRSCDVFFYQLGLELGVDAIAEEARLFGLGERTRIGINREQAGNVPTEAWKQKVYKQPWVGGETASVAIGQGYVTTTPLQMARVVAALANNGQVVKPRLISHTKNIENQKITNYPTEVVGDVGIAPENLELIVQGMDNAINTKEGTAYWRGRSTKYRIAGKTGTAQVVKQRAGEKMKGGFEDHAWFVAFAPIEDPKIAVAILVEHGGHGGTAAAPIALQIIETHLDPPAPLEGPKPKPPVKIEDFEQPAEADQSILEM